MTDNEIIEMFARREGFTMGYGLEWSKADLSILPNYLNSRDALQPVLKSLNPTEQAALTRKFLSDEIGRMDAFWYALILPARDLARAIAEVITRKAGD